MRPSKISASPLSTSSRGRRFFFPPRPDLDPPLPSSLSARALSTPSVFLEGVIRDGVVVPFACCWGVGVALPTPLPRPENMRPNSLLMPGLSPPGPTCLGCAPCTACGRGELRPFLFSSGLMFSTARCTDPSLPFLFGPCASMRWCSSYVNGRSWKLLRYRSS